MGSFGRRAVLGVALTGLAACTDAGEADTMGPPMVTVGTTVSGSTTGSSSSSGTGGAGGMGPCLGASASAPYFSVETAELCVVARYDAADLTSPAPATMPTWGSQDGPLTSKVVQNGASADVHIQRWAISGKTLVSTETVANDPAVSNPATFTHQIVDLSPTLSAVAWSGSDVANDGNLVLTGATSVVHSFKAPGVTALGVIGGASSTRVLYVGLAPLDGAIAATPSLYAADVQSNGTLASPAIAVSAWGTIGGPIAIDSAKNAFHLQANDATSAELRGFASTAIAPGAAATPGTMLAKPPGAPHELAAVAPKSGKPGLLLVQSVASGGPTDVVVQRYASDGTTISAMGTSDVVLKLAAAKPELGLMTDNAGRVWVSAPNAEGGNGTVFFVLDRP